MSFRHKKKLCFGLGLISYGIYKNWWTGKLNRSLLKNFVN